MHGLINKSIQCFLRDTYGEALWQRVAGAAGLGNEHTFEPLLHYDDALTEAVVVAALRELERTRDVLFEDMGTFLASFEALRRLLRFGGGDYLDFLLSLEDLPGRGRLALPDLELPGFALSDSGAGKFLLKVESELDDWTPVIAGLLRAMADDYGALVLIEPHDEGKARNTILITLLEARYAEGRSFDLANKPVVFEDHTLMRVE